MRIEVKGHSGCSVKIEREGKFLYIIKENDKREYATRLYRQALKQQKAFSEKYEDINVPEIYQILTKDGHTMIRMEYIYSKNFIEYFEFAGAKQISSFIDILIKFIKREIESCQYDRINTCIIKDKYKNVKEEILNNSFLRTDTEILSLLNMSELIFLSLPDYIKMPIGRCHGDLTFSNILFHENNYYLIDFLDSFLESPLIDMVKLRQDSQYLWSSLMYNGVYDRTRLKIVCRKIDKEFHREFEKYIWYHDYYSIFQLMNFFRVLQYAHEEKVIAFLKKNIKSLIEDDDINSSNSIR